MTLTLLVHFINQLSGQRLQSICVTLSDIKFQNSTFDLAAK